MDPRLRQRLMGQGQGVDAVPDNLFAQATAAAQSVPQDQQLEAQDETPDTTTDDTTPPAVPPAPDTPPEVAIANSQTNEQADGKTPPTIHMPEDPALRMAGNAQSGGPINPMAPPPAPASSGQSEGPNYGQLADVARRARGQDTENINRWNLGEGLKEAFAIARGQHYAGRPYGGALEEPAVEKEQADTQKRIQEYLTRKRQGEIDTRQGKLVESEIEKNKAEAGKFAREPEAHAGATKPDPAAYKKALKADPLMLQQYHGKADELAKAIDSLPDDEKALSDFAGGIRGQSKGINLAVTTENLGEKKQAAEKMETEGEKLSGAWDENDRSLKLIADQRALVQKYGRNLFAPTTTEERVAQKQANSIAKQLGDLASQATTGANRLPNHPALEQFNNDIIGNPAKFGLGELLDGPENQLAAVGEYEKALLHKRTILKAHFDDLPDDVKGRHKLFQPQAAKTVTVRDTKTGKQKTLDAATAAEVLKDHEFVAVP